MPIPGETKQMYCSICGRETTWEYRIVQLDDGLLGFENCIRPEVHQIRMWQCHGHMTPEGRLKEELKPHKQV